MVDWTTLIGEECPWRVGRPLKRPCAEVEEVPGPKTPPMMNPLVATPPLHQASAALIPSQLAPMTPLPHRVAVPKPPPPPPPPRAQGAVARPPPPGLTPRMIAVLDEHRVDSAARHALGLLAERGATGMLIANENCWKLVKRHLGSVPLFNASAFVARCVENAYCQRRV